MNKNIKMLATIVPLIVVPLINERKNITKHPDVQKLGAVSNSVYTRVKDSSKHLASNAYETTKSTAQNIGDKVSHTLDERSYNKEVKNYQKSLNKEESLDKKFARDKAAHKAERENAKDDKNRSIVPKIFQSHHDKTADEMEDGMSVSEDFIVSNEVTPDINVDKLTEPDNQEPDYGEMYMFEDEEDEQDELIIHNTNQKQTKESSEKMQNIKELNEEKVLNHLETEETNNEETPSLHEQHKNILDPRSAARDKHTADKKKAKQELRNDNSLFNKHRRLNFEHANKLERKVGDGSQYNKDQSIKDYESLMFNK